MKTSVPLICFLAIGGALLFSAPQDQQAPAQKKGGKKGDKSGPKKVELPHPFYWAAPDDFRGDWQGNGYVAQVFPTMDKIFSVQDSIPQQADNGLYQANIFRKFDVANDTPVAVLHDIEHFEILDCRCRPHIETVLAQDLRKYHCSHYEDPEKFAETNKLEVYAAA